ncbi:SURF1 family protein [Salinisphaera sp. Q1T1-3]|uniref:SURF1 family protein n=1 Tax=Salinisphaera sp. Q1T1-3 TaxID=2321229 RepID=UPI000E75355A|nr:SURF1 family protein [Salinisphaera sp. Q1T1-3]RJS94332.1 SURF1 family protein [Salinisphaera sp. Q1T1-3]
MRLGRYRFSPPWWGIAITALGVVILCLLGNWQIDRAHQKERLQAAQSRARAAGPQPMDLTRVSARDSQSPALKYGYRYIAHGRYDPHHQVLLADQVDGTRNGYRVWTPLVLDSGVRVMVDRGWIAKSPDPKAEPPNPGAPQGLQTVHGFWRTFPRPGLRFGNNAICDKSGWPRVLSYPSTATVRCQYGAPIADGLLLLSPEAPGGFKRDWDVDNVGLSPFAHYAYASQWFLMALVAIGLFVWTNLRRVRR